MNITEITNAQMAHIISVGVRMLAHTLFYIEHFSKPFRLHEKGKMCDIKLFVSELKMYERKKLNETKMYVQY